MEFIILILSYLLSLRGAERRSNLHIKLEIAHLHLHAGASVVGLGLDTRFALLARQPSSQ
ncbi:MAG: hypothetical protein AB1554_13515 [Chloroflexota bacterium]